MLRGPYHPELRLANFFCKGPVGRQVFGPYCLCCNYSTRSVQPRTNSGQCVINGHGCVPIKLFTESGKNLGPIQLGTFVIPWSSGSLKKKHLMLNHIGPGSDTQCLLSDIIGKKQSYDSCLICSLLVASKNTT